MTTSSTHHAPHSDHITDHDDDAHVHTLHAMQQQTITLTLPLWQWIVVHSLAGQHDTTPDVITSVILTNTMNTASEHGDETD